MVVSLIKPAAFQIDSGITAGGKRMNAKVRNAAPPRTVSSMVLNTACGAYGYTGFKPGISPFPVEAGQSVGGDVIVAALANSVFQANYESPIRCRYTLTAYAATDFTVDATPWNNVATFDVDILDLNQSEMSAVHETTISVVKPVKLKIKDGATSVTKKIKLKVGSADYLPAPEDAASHPVSVSGSSDCTALSIGTPTFRGTHRSMWAAATPSPERSRSPSPLPTCTRPTSRTRCDVFATLTAADHRRLDAGNDAASVVVDVIDLNDF
jgi:hypothetical protein